MKATLEFDLPDDADYYQMVNSAIDYFCALNHIKQQVRQIHKHREMSEEQFAIVEEIYEIICSETAKFANL